MTRLLDGWLRAEKLRWNWIVFPPAPRVILVQRCIQRNQIKQSFIFVANVVPTCLWPFTSSRASSSISRLRLWTAVSRAFRASSFLSSAPSICLVHPIKNRKGGKGLKVPPWNATKDIPQTGIRRFLQSCFFDTPNIPNGLASMVSSSSTPASSASEIADLRSRIPQCRCVSWELRAFTALTFEPRRCSST